ncbi:hypothetical protein NDU88_001619 [Pleurodeles waltl]|uniref:Uncharacterized protein n=1 Tax=Pleurodeles waltl TaxID=8319 RepID=A0AAV7P6C5_PLEWA|nr:hypothetical protein NDU88_001619 [Pleurodeles waltl]
MTADEAVSISAGECSATPIVNYARETTEETDVDNEAVKLTPVPQMGESRPLRTAGSGRRRHRLTHDAGEEDVTTEQFLGLKASLLSSHRLQIKHMRMMSWNLQQMQ